MPKKNIEEFEKLPFPRVRSAARFISKFVDLIENAYCIETLEMN